MSRIVVGLDGSEPSRAALAFAAEEARLRGATLHAVHVWRLPLALALPEPSIGGFAPVSVDDLEQIAERLGREAGQLLDGEVERVLGKSPDVDVRKEVIESNPATALLEAAEGADLLVVGNRGRGGFAGLLLGSVSQHAVHHAACPVVVIPHDRMELGEPETDGHALSIQQQ